MPRYLVIVESPAKCKTISKILGKDYKVLASYGHICDLPKSKLGIDLNDFSLTHEIIHKKADVIQSLRTAADACEMVFLCTDMDREGEAISKALLDVLGIKCKYQRASFSEITPKAILEAIANPKKINDKLVDAQQARRALDRIVGYKVSPLLWKKVKRGLSAGRVQSVAVRMISDREKEIAAFEKDEYWTIDADFKDSRGIIKASLKSIDDRRIVDDANGVEKAKSGVDLKWTKNKVEADAIVADMKKSSYLIAKVTKSEVKERPYPPFSTSLLQMASANRLGFDTKKTMRVAQSLYEGLPVGSHGHVGLITYMRTDSFHVSGDAQAAARTLITSKYGGEFYPDKPNFYKSKAGAQGAHECVRPTRPDMEPEAIRAYLQPDQYKLYKLVWERFVSSQMSPATYDSQSVDIESTDGKYLLKATGRRAKFKGWTIVYSPETDDDKDFPEVPAWPAETRMEDARAGQHFTQPPPRYTDASLVKALEQNGIGRPSTYASIIQVIQDRRYVEKTGRGGKAPFKATDLGMVVTDSLVAGVPSIMDAEFTRNMEEELDRIEDGSKTYRQVLGAFWQAFQKELGEADKRMPSPKGGEPTCVPCPKCGKPLTKLLGSRGFFLKCVEKECSHTQDLDGKQKDTPTGIKCDKCGADVIRMSGRFGDYLACAEYKGKKCDFTMGLTKKGLPQRKMKPVQTGIKCDKCGNGSMVIRVSRRKKVPGPFLSCDAFPKCRNATELPCGLEAEGERVMVVFGQLRAKDTEDAKKMLADDGASVM